MHLSFEPLKESHFPLMLKWLQSPHVQQWWPRTSQPEIQTENSAEADYTLEDIKAKYSSYVKGYKSVDGARKPIQGFIIQVEQASIGYIQIYQAYDFPRSKPLLGLPQSLGAFDMRPLA